VVRTFRQECLDHVIVRNGEHLRALLTELVHYYNHDRPHRTLELQTPVPSPPMSGGAVAGRPILGDFTTATRGRHERCSLAVLHLNALHLQKHRVRAAPAGSATARSQLRPGCVAGSSSTMRPLPRAVAARSSSNNAPEC
jgi:transposase InsO family protein